jgi:hypothetical protein
LIFEQQWSVAMAGGESAGGHHQDGRNCTEGDCSHASLLSEVNFISYTRGRAILDLR